MDYETGQTALVYHLNDGGYKTNYDEFKEADSIVELCDKFIGKANTNIILNRYEYEMFKEYIEYGAIWTIGKNNEPILKSVAKMNDDGELKLL